MSSKSNSTASNGSTATATMMAAANGGTPAKYEARLCHVVKRPDFDGYGFNLHAEKGRPGQYIGKVDDASPAEAAGLRQGDRIIEVNSTNITTETHKKVVELIKAVPNETRLLVIDPRADANDLKLALAKSAVAAAVAAQPAPTNNGTANGSSNNNNNNSITNSTGASSNGHHHHVANGGTPAGQKDTPPVLAEEGKKSPKTGGNGTTTILNNNNTINNNNHSSSSSNGNGNGTTDNNGTPPVLEKIIDDTKKILTVTTDGAGAGKMALNGNGTVATEPSSKPAAEGKKLNLPMTAAEMRAQLAARKKYDPKSEVCDLRKKYEIIQKM